MVLVSLIDHYFPDVKVEESSYLGRAMASVFISNLESTWELATAQATGVLIIWP